MKMIDAGRTAALWLALAVAGGAFERITAQTLVPERIGTVEVPLSQSGSIALLSDENTACVFDSYEVQVRCVDRSGDVVGVFGREGEGPGEFGWLYRLVGGRNNTLGTVDNRLQRFTVFEPSGALVSEVSLPGETLIMSPASRFSTTVAVVSTVTWDASVDQGGLALFEIDLASAEATRTEVPPVDAQVECETINYGFPDPRGGWVYVACEGHMVFVAEDGRVSMLQAPTYTGELPHERDFAVMEEANRGTQRFGGLWDREALEQYRSTPKNYHLVLGEQKFDEQGMLWIATQRDRDEFSYLDVYDPAEAAFVGSVRVDDRIMGFDLLGSTLVVVVERQLSPDDADGIADRAVDWYDISEWR